MKKISFIVLVLCATGLDAQFKRPFFNTISVENGLPEGVVRVSLQDKLGYLWFGTQNGLVRYNGYNCKLYPIPDDDGAPINAPSINNLLEDKFGVLWVGLYNKGYYIYDRQKDIFKKIPKDKIALDSFNVAGTSKFLYDKENDIGWGMRYDTGLGSWAVELADFFHGSHEVFSAAGKGRYLIPAGKNYADIMVDSSGNAWLVTDSLLSRYDKGSASFKPFFLLPANMNKIMFNYIMQDPVNKDLIWITTDPDSSLDINKTKIIQVNIKTKKYKTYDHIASDPFSIAGTCTEMYTDPQKRIFFYTAHGISMFNRENEKFTNYVLSAPGIAANIPIPITSIAADKKGNLWLGGNDFNGLFCLNTNTAAINYYSHTEEGGSLPNFTSGINKLFFDKAGILWVSLPFSGIAWLDPKRSFFNPVIIDPPVKKEDKNTGTEFYNITGFYNDSIFFVRDTKNIFTWNHRTNDFNKIDLGEPNKSVGVKSVYVDKQGLIWMSSFLGYGLFCYNPYDKTTKNYRNDPKDSFSIGSNYTSMVREDNDGNLWISTGGNGLNSFNKKTGRFTRYPFITNNGTIKPNNALDDRIVHCVLCNKNGIIWIGTNLGSLNKLDTKTGKFSTYLDPKAGFQCIEDLFEDNHGRLWAGSYLSGLFLVNKDSGILKHFTETDGLPSNDIRSINEDKKGNIWLATSHGLSKLDPVSNTITNYTTVNGLSVVQTQEIYKNSDGMFYVSITNGVIPFDPDDFAENKIPPEVVIESIKYHTSANNRDTILPISEPQQLSLRYNENKISFQYVALHFSNAALNQYAYQLVGYDKDWIPAGTARTVTYTNLSPGTYTFKVKAANSDGVWNETGAGFTFTILPPWWKTWWAYCLYALVIGGIVWAYVQYRSKALRRENLVLEQKVEHRTKQLQLSIESLKATQSQLIQSEKMASLGELTAGIAHEIQNPLNFVNNFSEVNKELIDELQEERNKEQGTRNEELQTELLNDIKQNLEKINHHGKRADAIVKGMLQHSRSSNGVKEPTDINALADEYLRLAYHGLRAKDKSFNATLKTDFDESIGNITIIPQDIGRVLLNLITNAFYVVDEKKKQSAPGYEAIVSISTKKINNKVEIKVADNGNGIPKNIIDKIFQPFFTTKPTGQGTGLGLSLAYDIIKAHGGELKVETKEEEGTEFIIHLPVNLNNQPGSNQNV